MLVDNAVIAGWIREGLPSDPTSVQNGTILTNSERWSLMMDPQLQGIVWIKERESKNSLVVLRMGADGMVTKMERAIEAGHSVLIENMAESIDAVLNPIITRSTFKKVRGWLHASHSCRCQAGVSGSPARPVGGEVFSPTCFPH